MAPQSINLKDILRLIFPSEEITWITDQPRSDLALKWVCLNYENGRPEDLLILSAKEINQKNLQNANKMGIVAILLIGEKKGLPDINTNLPVVLVNTDIDIRQVQEKFLKLLIHRNEFLAQNKLQIHTRLSRLAADGLELKELANAILEISRHGILIHDKRLNVIANSPSTDLQPVWEDIIEQLSKSSSLPAPFLDRKKAGEENLKITQQLPGGISRIIVPITAGKVARGYLSIIGLDGTLDILDHIVAEEGALICAIDMSRTKAVRETEKKLQSDLLTALLQENISPRDAKLWFDAIGLDPSQAHTALQFSWDSESPPSRRRLETLIHGEIIHTGVTAIINPAGEAVICFCQVPPTNNGQDIAVSLAKNIIKRAQHEFPTAQLRCGIGSPSHDLNRWHISFKEAGLALDMASRLGKKDPLYYPDLSVHRLLLLLENNPELKVFQKDILGSLLPEDKSNNFIETLEAYFENNRNLSQAAEALFIHRNTLSYRLERIREISGLELNNYDTALAVQLALKIYRLTKSN